MTNVTPVIMIITSSCCPGKCLSTSSPTTSQAGSLLWSVGYPSSSTQRWSYTWESGSTTWILFSCETVHSRRWSRAEWHYWSQFSWSWSTYSTPSRLTLHRSHFHTTFINRNLRHKDGENAWDSSQSMFLKNLPFSNNFFFSKSNYKWWNMNQVLSKIQSNRGHTLNNAR